MSLRYLISKHTIKRCLIMITCISLSMVIFKMMNTKSTHRDIPKTGDKRKTDDKTKTDDKPKTDDKTKTDDKPKTDQKPQIPNKFATAPPMNLSTYPNLSPPRHSQDSFPYRTINPDSQKYVLDPTPWAQQCTNISLLIYVHSAGTHSAKRTAIRSSWGSKLSQTKLNMRLVFLLGVSINQTVNKEIKLENGVNQDIIQEDYIDTYYNISVKAISAMKFTRRYCSHVPLILKTDDDVYVNVLRLAKFIQVQPSKIREIADNKKLIICNKRSDQTPVRVYDKDWVKWLVTVKEYRYHNYPTFCQGVAFFLTSSAVRDILSASREQEFFKLDDVFLTGLLAKRAGVGHQELNNEYDTMFDPWSEDTTGDRFMFTGQKLDRFVTLWKRHFASLPSRDLYH